MALINCPNCGKEIYDKSTVCVGCGYPIAENFREPKVIFCKECGEALSEDAVACPKCGCPVTITPEKGKKKKGGFSKKGLIAIILVVVVALCAGVLYFATPLIMGVDLNGYYNGFEWGTSYTDVKASLAGVDIYESEDPYYDSIGVNIDRFLGMDVDGTVHYWFDDESLERVYISIRTEGLLSGEEMVEKIIKMFSRIYGEPVYENYDEYTLGWVVEPVSAIAVKCDADYHSIEIRYGDYANSGL